MLAVSLRLPHGADLCINEGTRTLQDIAGKENVVEVDLSTALREANRADNEVIFLAPGGHAIQMLGSISQTEQTGLRDSVRAGAGYIGFCAGSMLGAETLVVKYESRGEPKQLTQPMLGLLKGVVADGPAYRSYIGRPIGGEYLRPTSVLTQAGDPVVSYWLHGPAFRGKTVGSPPPCNVDAVFSDGGTHAPAATVSGKCGKGSVVLSAVHYEIETQGEGPGEASAREFFMSDLYDKATPSE